MKLIWTPRAVEDLQEIVDFIGGDSSHFAAKVSTRIFTKVEELSSMPNIGRMGEIFGTRELIFYPWPYIAVYRVTNDAVRILRIRHAAQTWP